MAAEIFVTILTGFGLGQLLHYGRELSAMEQVIGIISRDRGGLSSTAHVRLALRTSDGVLHFLHASSPSNYGRVVVDSQLSKYLYRYGSDSGILVARPLR